MATHHDSNSRIPNAFMTTRWSRVVKAGDGDADRAHEALSSLCGDYWRPLYHFARRKGHSAEDAQDLTQGFIMSMLERGSFSRADRERGKFRTFLISAFCNYLKDQHRNRNTQKRGGGQLVFSLDEDPEAGFVFEAVDEMTPESQFELSWVHALLGRVMARLRENYNAAEKLPLYEALQPHLSGASGRPGYARIGAELGMSEAGVTSAMHRMRRRYGEFLREEVAATTSSPAEVEEELAHLMKVVARG